MEIIPSADDLVAVVWYSHTIVWLGEDMTRENCDDLMQYNLIMISSGEDDVIAAII